MSALPEYHFPPWRTRANSPLLRERDAAVIEQVAVADEVGAAAAVYEVHVPAERLALAEGVDVLVHQRLLLRAEGVGVGGVDGGEVRGVERVDARVELTVQSL